MTRHPARSASVASILLGVLVAGGSAGGDAPSLDGAGLSLGAFVDVLAEAERLPTPDDPRAVVLIFVGHDCPISNGYSPEIVRICREYMPRGVDIRVVYADADLPEEQARAHARDFGFVCPALLDPRLELARRLGATVKPEAAVLSPRGELLYLGRIDDLHLDFGKRRARPTSRDLRRALDALLAGKPVPVPRTEAVGCYIDFSESDRP